MTLKSFFQTTILVLFLISTSPAQSFLHAQETAKPAATPAPAQTPPRTVKETYNAIQVDPFDIQKDVNFPAEYLAALQTEITKQLVNAKIFAEVVPAGQTPSLPNPHLLRLTGLITNFDPGSRAKRYFGGSGAGATEIDSKVSFLDAATSQPLMSQDLRAILSSGFFGGKSEDAVKDYARQVVNKARLMLNMRLSAPGTVPSPIVAQVDGSVPSSAPAKHTVSLSEKNWPGSQQKLNQEAADGYRLIGLTITGKSTADAEFVRTDAIADAFRYRLLHTLLSSSLQKDINKLAQEGFRVSPGTLVILGTSPIVVVEKSSPPFKLHYQYIIKETVLVSSAQKDTEKIQSQGYTLIGETEHGTNHILLFEKSSPGE
jgi:hypothetical protein